MVFGGVHRPCIVKRLVRFGVRKIMVSFADPLSEEGWRIARKHGMEVWLDSGAYSAWKRGAEIDIEDYADYIRRHKPDVYFNLDVVGDPSRTSVNQGYLEKLGLNPIPVFHMDERFTVLDDLVKKHQLIGLGGHVGRNPRKWFDECFSRHTVRFHGLGVTRKIITEFPFWSVDSSWWQCHQKTGGGQAKLAEQAKRIQKLNDMRYRGYVQYQERLF